MAKNIGAALLHATAHAGGLSLPTATVKHGTSPGALLLHKTIGPSSGTHPTSVTVGAPPPKHHHSGGVGGFLAGVEHTIGGAAHTVASKAELAAHDIAGIPGGIVKLGGALLTQAPGESLSHQWSDLFHGHLHFGAGDPLKPITKGIVQGTVASLEHPGRDPFQTLLTLSMVGGGVAGAAGRLSFAGKALAAAKAADAAGDAATAAKLRLAATRAMTHTGKPPVTGRTIQVPKLEHPAGGAAGPAKVVHEPVGLVPSKGPLAHALQAGHDKVIQKSLDKNIGKAQPSRLSKYATGRVQKSLDETTRIQTRDSLVPVQQLEAAGHGRKAFGPGVSNKLGQLALFLRSANVTGKEAADYWAGQAAKGVNPAATGKLAKLAQAVHAKGLLHLDGGNVEIHPDFPKLVAAKDLLVENQAARESIIREHGIMDDPAMQKRLDLVGQRMAGGEYVKPTPGKLGVPSQGLVKIRSNVARLQTLHDRALEKIQATKVGPEDAIVGTRVVGPGAARLSGAKGAINQSAARLDGLEKLHAKALDEIVAGKFGPISRKEVNARTQNNLRAARQEGGVTRSGKKSGASTEKAIRLPTVKQERRNQAEKLAEEFIAANPSHPLSVAWRKRTAEIDKLSELVNPEFGVKQKGVVTGAGRVVGAPGSARADRIGAALSVAKDKLQQMEAAAAKRETPTGIVGGESARPGQGFTPLRTSVKRGKVAVVSSAAGRVIGKPRSFVDSKVATGEGVAKGLVPDNTTAGVARSMREALRFLNTTKHRALRAKYGSDVKASPDAVLIRDPAAEKAGKITPRVDQAVGRTESTLGTIPETEHVGMAERLRAHLEQVIPGLKDEFQGDRAAAIGTRAPAGYKWVPEKLLGDVAEKAGPKTRVGRAVDTVNSAVTAATVYFKPGHIGTRVFTNAATNIIQGAARPIEIGRSVRLWHALTPRERLQALQATGTHGVAALPHEGQNWVSRAAGRGALAWARRVDAPFRFNALAYEARDSGFTTVEDFRRMLRNASDPGSHGLSAAEASKADWVVKRANRVSIMYDGLAPWEKKYIARVFWFYPWTKGAVRYAGHTVAEHPVGAAALGALGQQGRLEQRKRLGDVPSYEFGLIPMGGGKTTNLETFTPFGTSAQVLNAVARPGTISGMANPVYGAVDQLVHGITPYGNKTTHPVGSALSTLFSPTPEAQILDALLHKRGPGATFHPTVLSALARALAGPWVPRGTNTAALNSGAARERSGR